MRMNLKSSMVLRLCRISLCALGLAGCIISQPMAPPPPPPVITFQAPPVMIWEPGLGMYIAVDTSYDFFYYGGYYFYARNGLWYRSVSYGGPWIYSEPRFLPPVFHQHRLIEIRGYRERMYREYRSHPNTFRDRRFDHHADRFATQYDREYMRRNKGQLQKERAANSKNVKMDGGNNKKPGASGSSSAQDKTPRNKKQADVKKEAAKKHPEKIQPETKSQGQR